MVTLQISIRLAGGPCFSSLCRCGSCSDCELLHGDPPQVPSGRTSRWNAAWDLPPSQGCGVEQVHRPASHPTHFEYPGLLNYSLKKYSKVVMLLG